MASQSTVSSHRVVVVGGGITGLTAALRLAQAAQRDARLGVFLLEQAGRVGGKIRTERMDGFLVEHGPDTFLARKPEAIALCRELSLAEDLVPTNPQLRRAFVSRGLELHELPEGMSGLVPSRLGPLFKSGVLSVRGKLRAACEPLIRKSPEQADESVAAFVRRRLGREAYDYLVEPLLCGIHAGDGEHLSLAATTPLLRDMEEEHGSVLRGLRLRDRAVHQELDRFPTPFVSLSGGLQQMVDVLVRRLDAVTVRVGAEVVGTRRAGDRYTLELSDGGEIDAPTVIYATPSYATAGLVETINPALAAVLRTIPFVSNAAVTMAFRQTDVPRRLDGYGYVVPRREGRAALACSWASSKLPSRAPEGSVLLRMFVGRAGQEIDATTDDTALVDMARAETQSTLGISATPTFARVSRHPRGMPQYTLGHLARLDEIDRLLEATPGIWLAGNSYQGVGISDCIRSGQKAAFRALRYLQERLPG